MLFILSQMRSNIIECRGQRLDPLESRYWWKIRVTRCLMTMLIHSQDEVEEEEEGWAINNVFLVAAGTVRPASFIFLVHFLH